jgi:hypothetical protein
MQERETAKCRASGKAAKADLHDARTLVSQKCEDPGHARTSKRISAFGAFFRSLESGLCNEEIHTAKAIRHYFHLPCFVSFFENAGPSRKS